MKNIVETPDTGNQGVIIKTTDEGSQKPITHFHQSTTNEYQPITCHLTWLPSTLPSLLLHMDFEVAAAEAASSMPSAPVGPHDARFCGLPTVSSGASAEDPTAPDSTAGLDIETLHNTPHPPDNSEGSAVDHLWDAEAPDCPQPPTAIPEPVVLRQQHEAEDEPSLTAAPTVFSRRSTMGAPTMGVLIVLVVRMGVQKVESLVPWVLMSEVLMPGVLTQGMLAAANQTMARDLRSAGPSVPEAPPASCGRPEASASAARAAEQGAGR